MHRWLTVAVVSLGIVFLGADAPPVTGESVTVLNSTDVNGGLSVLQVAYVSAKIGDLLDTQGVIVNREPTRVPSIEKSGPYLCSDAKTALLLAPSIVATAAGEAQGIGNWNTVRIVLEIYDCSTKTIKRITGGPNSGFNWTAAADRSIADAVKHYISGR
jgi:hypothetical protein